MNMFLFDNKINLKKSISFIKYSPGIVYAQSVQAGDVCYLFVTFFW